jgi:NAD(P)-dependent dehydrogenase (short-subunit alcohol dehydrogenase family)
MDLKDRVVWITGGASGIGKETAKKVVEKGAKVLITDIQLDKGEKFAADLGENAIFIKADQRIPEELIAAVDKTYKKWRRIDCLVNSAGIGTPCSALPLTMEITTPTQFRYVVDFDAVDKGIQPLDDFMEDINTDLIGSFNAARIAAFYMVKNEPNEHGERGSMVFISSMAANKYALGGSAGYAAAKAGVLGLSRELAHGLGSAGIRCNAILPGAIDTPLISIDNYPPELQEVAKVIGADSLYKQSFPMDRIGQPEIIATMAIELLQNWFANGANFQVDGGYRA